MGKKSASSAVSRSVTLSAVARLAVVSLPTASRILNPGVRGALTAAGGGVDGTFMH